eukprot:5099415-Amphidinium_carterae.2
MDNVKTQTVPISDDSYIDHRLHDKGLGQYDATAAREREQQRLLQDYTRRTEPLIGRSEGRRQRREARETRVEQDEAIPRVPNVPDTLEPSTEEQRKMIAEYTQAFHFYSKALQYTLTRSQKEIPTDLRYMQPQQLKRI